jgi:hypothetical protein
VKYAVLVLSAINGLWMLIDGIYVVTTGKYIGPEKPGPWASILGLTGVDIFKLGPLFVAFGIAWLVFVCAYAAEAPWVRIFGLVLAALTIWYLPFGTLISIFVFIALFFFVKG